MLHLSPIWKSFKYCHNKNTKPTFSFFSALYPKGRNTSIYTYSSGVPWYIIVHLDIHFLSAFLGNINYFMISIANFLITDFQYDKENHGKETVSNNASFY